ncbi:hypothetical protein C8F04DRAFT_344994 [Mycena alexandri]|uniref:Uncharacterized protein n=1 Tax=Mycena alexandri TaxID=1745969 RepID=A0AAD6THP8_9AGAR|nr:hypothetical protein C8F04DRAFT_344994 [Mycena alexandri]
MRLILLLLAAIVVVLAAPLRTESLDAKRTIANRTDRGSTVRLQLSASAKVSAMLANNSTVINGTEHTSVMDPSPSGAPVVIVASIATSTVEVNATVLDRPPSQTPLVTVLDSNNNLINDTGHTSVLDSSPSQSSLIAVLDTIDDTALDSPPNQTPLLAGLETNATLTNGTSGSIPSPTATTPASATLIFFFLRVGRLRHLDDTANTTGGQSSAAIPSATPGVVQSLLMDDSDDPDKVSPSVIRALVAVILIAAVAYLALYSFWKCKRPLRAEASPATRLQHRRMSSMSIAIPLAPSPGLPSPTDTMLTLVNADAPPKVSDDSATDPTVSNDVPVFTPQRPPTARTAGRGGRGRNAIAEAHSSHF